MKEKIFGYEIIKKFGNDIYDGTLNDVVIFIKLERTTRWLWEIVLPKW